ncbi:hypothetical protein EGH25_06840 [Haladaptatus sp. F3-133]|jgi:hypothetical protein|uniref:Uncharacterized protein n=1 Tax=Halorutilus salinus TaxID=2487751 RepID=A0A9Q4GJB6_9EURY|nr:hypothetical protein [Halorutilus salinus]MCX2819066.1 hypothetical protein [Halorutilus salinus]
MSQSIRREDTAEGVTVIDERTGEKVTAETYVEALEELAQHLSNLATLNRLFDDVQKRFDETGTTEDDVEEAIEWARDR